MHPILILLCAIVGVGAILYLHHRLSGGDKDIAKADAEIPATDETPNTDDECCGMHIVCEHDSLSTGVADPTDYYDDEELDNYAGRNADEYNADEIEIFRDILLTLRPEEIAPWARAIQRRGITLPSPIRDELLMIVAEARSKLKIKNETQS